MDAPILRKDGRYLVLWSGDGYAKARFAPSTLQDDAPHIVRQMGEGLWIHLRGGLSKQRQFQDMLQRFKQPDFDYHAYLTWEDSWQKEQEEFIQAAVAQIGELTNQ